MGGKVCLRCKDKTLLGVVNKILWNKKVVDIMVKVMGLNPGYLLKPFVLSSVASFGATTSTLITIERQLFLDLVKKQQNVFLNFA